MHPEGYIHLKDRFKDIITSGGKNISFMEIENAPHKYSRVCGAAVVAMITSNDLKRWCQQHLTGYKGLKHFEFQPIIKTSTGKVQKFLLRSLTSGISENYSKSC